MNKPEHLDYFGRKINMGDPVAFSTSYDRGARVGTVITLTRLRVRVEYYYEWRDQQGNLHSARPRHLARSAETIVLDSELPKHMTMLALKGRL